MPFLAHPPRWPYNLSSVDTYTVGVAPEGTQLGDVVCTFLASRLALVFRPRSPRSSNLLHGSSYEELQEAGFALVGRAAVELPSDEEGQPTQALLSPDNTVEMVQNKTSLSGMRNEPWPATVSIDMPTLRLVTRAETALSLQDLAKTMPNTLSQEDLPAVLHTTSCTEANMNDQNTQQYIPNELEAQNRPRDLQLKKHPLGQGTAGIMHFGTTGYFTAVLQTLYMLAPLRKVRIAYSNVRTHKGFDSLTQTVSRTFSATQLYATRVS